MNSSILRWSLGGTQSSALKRPDEVSPRGTCPAIFAGRSETSKDWIARTPDWLSSSFFQTFSTPMPRGVTRPRPVMTTRLMSGAITWREGASGVGIDEADRVLHRDDL